MSVLYGQSGRRNVVGGKDLPHVRVRPGSFRISGVHLYFVPCLRRDGPAGVFPFRENFATRTRLVPGLQPKPARGQIKGNGFVRTHRKHVHMFHAPPWAEPGVVVSDARFRDPRAHTSDVELELVNPSSAKVIRRVVQVPRAARLSEFAEKFDPNVGVRASAFGVGSRHRDEEFLVHQRMRGVVFS